MENHTRIVELFSIRVSIDIEFQIGFQFCIMYPNFLSKHNTY